jgi:hypothetical protein
MASERQVHPATSVKIVTAIDAISTLFVEQVGFTFSLPAYHPLILGTVVGTTYVLIRHKDRISGGILDIADYARNKISADEEN